MHLFTLNAGMNDQIYRKKKMFEYEIFNSPENLKQQIFKLSTSLLRDQNSILPKWFNEDFDQIKKNPIIICGATCREEIRVLALEYQVIGIVDDELSKKEELLFGIPYISTSQWIDFVKGNKNIISCILVMTLRAYRHFIKQCIQHNLKYLNPIQILHVVRFYNLEMPSNGDIFRYGLNYFQFALENIENLIKNTEILVDNYSKISYLNIILYKLTLNPFYLETTAVGRGNKYDYNAYLFEKTYLNFTNKEVYVDAGAYTGDSIELFISAVKGNYKHIYSFEPNRENNIELIKRIEKLQNKYLKPLDESISIIHKGIWSEDCTLEFLTTKIVDLGGHFENTEMLKFQKKDSYYKESINVTSIDSATDQDATFIKYEIEGSEYQGLIGAEKTIVKNKPKLAVALYHKPEDILKLPSFIKELDMNYKIGFRQHDLFKPDATYMYCF